MPSLSMQQSLQAFYLGLFGRAADPEGFDYWAAQVESGAITLSGALGEMLSSDEFAERRDEFSANDEDIWIEEIYQDFFGREADEDGAEYWSSLASEGLSPQDLIQNMIMSAAPTDREALDATTSIARFYTDSIADSDYNPEQPLIQQGLRSNDQLYSDLAELDATYNTLALSQVGESLEGRPLYNATVGDGDRKLMIVTQQHGDEPTGTEASMLLLEWLSGDSEAAQALRSEITVSVMPRVNPDGFERWEQLAAGELDLENTIDPRRNAADVDLNRTWDSSEVIAPDTIPETMAIRQVLEAFDPELVLDYHNQNNYVNEADDIETMSVLWPTNELVDTEVASTAQKAAVAISQGLDDFDYGYLSLFPGGDTPQIARNGLAIDGVPALLIEQRGLEEMELATTGELDTDYSALSSALILESLLSMLGVSTAMANDELEQIDPELANSLPERGERINFEDIYLDEAPGGAPVQGEETMLAVMETSADIDSALLEVMGVTVPSGADMEAA